MATIDQVKAAAPSFSPDTWAASTNGCGRQLKPHPSGSLSSAGAEFRMSWKCLKTEAFAALSSITGEPESVVIFGNPVVRYIPLRHPIIPTLIASAVEFKDLGWDDATNDESHTHFDIVFRNPPYPQTGDHPYCELQKTEASRQLPVIASAWQFSGGEVPFHEPNYEIHGCEMSLVMHHVPAIVTPSSLEVYSRYTNSSVFMSYPAGCVQFIAPTVTPDVFRIGTDVATVILRFLTSYEVPWNYWPKADGTFALLTSNGTTGGRYRHPLIDFGGPAGIFTF